MSHGPCGLEGDTLAPAAAGCAIVDVTPIRVSASRIISPRLIFVVIFIRSALSSLFQHREETHCFLCLTLSCFFELPEALSINSSSMIDHALYPAVCEERAYLACPTQHSL